MDKSVLFALCLAFFSLWSGYWIGSLWEPRFRKVARIYSQYPVLGTIVVLGATEIVALGSVSSTRPQDWALVTLFTVPWLIVGWVLENKVNQRLLDAESQEVFRNRLFTICLMAVTAPCLAVASALCLTFAFLLPVWGWVTFPLGVIIFVCLYPPFLHALDYETWFIHAGGKKVFPAEYQTLTYALIATWGWVMILLTLGIAR